MAVPGSLGVSHIHRKECTMLIDVFAGQDRRSAASRGCFHFSRSPEPGEQVELEGELLIVTRTWHRPDCNSTGAKFAILVEEEDAGEPAFPCDEDAVTSERDQFARQGWREGS